jgi:hypothetical protein
MRIHRAFALVISALALTMTSAHVLEMPQKLSYDLPLYTAVNGSLYLYFAIVGGSYQVFAIILVAALAWRTRGAPHAKLRWLAAAAITLAFVSWLILVQPVNAAIADGASWATLRTRWEYGHLVGFVFSLTGFIALVIETMAHLPAAPPVHVEAARTVRASPEQLMALYLDFAGWPRLVRATIRGAHLVATDGTTSTVEVDHATAGTVRNVVTVTAPNQIALDEDKPLYSAHFVNRFDPTPEGCRYQLIADIELRGAWRALSWLVPAIARRQLQRSVLAPMQRAAEAS